MHALIAMLFGVSPITGGTLDSGDRAVVAVLDADGRHTCTGTLITDYVVVTAAHCVATSYRGMSVVVGSDVATGEHVAVVDGRVHPAWDPQSGANDIAVLFLATRFVTTAVLRPDAPLDAVLADASVRLVGFGETSGGAGDGGTKRTGTSMVSAVRGDEIDLVAAPSLACVGDSGGPVFVVAGKEVIAGVISRGNTACTTTTATRVDAHAAFIDAYLAETGPNTAGAYERCLHAEQCGFGVCVIARDEPAIRYCAPLCSDDDECTMANTECIDGACHYRLPTPGAFGAACSADAECANGNCAAPDGESLQVCTERCVPGANTCPDDTECLRVVGAEHGCFAPEETGCGCASTRADASWLLALLWFSRRVRSGSRGSAARREIRSRDS